MHRAAADSQREMMGLVHAGRAVTFGFMRFYHRTPNSRLCSTATVSVLTPWLLLFPAGCVAAVNPKTGAASEGCVHKNRLKRVWLCSTFLNSTVTQWFKLDSFHKLGYNPRCAHRAGLVSFVSQVKFCWEDGVRVMISYCCPQAGLWGITEIVLINVVIAVSWNVTFNKGTNTCADNAHTLEQKSNLTQSSVLFCYRNNFSHFYKKNCSNEGAQGDS